VRCRFLPISIDHVIRRLKTNSAYSDAIAELEFGASSPGVKCRVRANSPREVEKPFKSARVYFYSKQYSGDIMAEIRNPFPLSPLQPIQRLEGKTDVSMLQLRSQPAKCAGERPANGHYAPAQNGSSSRAIRDDLAEVAAAWGEMQSTRKRDGVYLFLQAVYDLVGEWERRGRADRKARRALRARDLKAPKYPEPYAAVIACTSNADIKARSKWARALQFVCWYNCHRKPLKEFIKSKGGINGCASLFARRLGRLSKNTGELKVIL
jgi:hypothetical protein